MDLSKIIQMLLNPQQLQTAASAVKPASSPGNEFQMIMQAIQQAIASRQQQATQIINDIKTGAGNVKPGVPGQAEPDPLAGRFTRPRIAGAATQLIPQQLLQQMLQQILYPGGVS